MRSSVSIALFFLLSGLFLSLLLGAIERSRKLLAVAGGFLVAVVCIIVLLTPVQLPNLGWWGDDEPAGATAGTTTSSVLGAAATSTTKGTINRAVATTTSSTTTSTTIATPSYTVTSYGTTSTTGGHGGQRN